jgi:hypothetical protein
MLTVALLMVPIKKRRSLVHVDIDSHRGGRRGHLCLVYYVVPRMEEGTGHEDS